jgi:CHAT domain-containing protein/tetratricopeptide (TPR) repeat protein
LLAAQIPIAATETLAHLGRHDEALSLAASLEQRLRALGAEEDAAKVLANAGNIHFERDAYREAMDCWTRALAYFDARGEHVSVARLRMNLANVLTHLSRLPEALRMYEAARAALEQAGMDVLVAGIDANLGFLQFMAGRYTEALQSYARARRRFEALHLAKDIAKCDRETADVYLELNLMPEAHESFEQVLPVFRELQMSAEAARAEMGLAIALAAQGRGDESLVALQRAEQAFQREENEIGVARARLQRAEWWRAPAASPTTDADGTARPGGDGQGGDGAGLQAAKEARAAVRAFRKHGLNAGSVQARLRLAEMRIATGGCPTRSLARLLREARDGAYVSLIWRIEAALARANMNANRRRAALTHYRRAVEAVDRMRLLLRGDDFRIAFLQDKMRVYEEMLSLLLDRGTPAAFSEGFQVAERAKSRTLLELLAGPVEERASDSPERQVLLQRMEELRARLNWDYQRLQHLDGNSSRLPMADAALPDRVRYLEWEYARTRRQLQVGSEAPDGQADAAVGWLGPAVRPDIVSVKDLQALLDDDEQLIEYVTVRNEVLAFVIDRKHLRTVRFLAPRVAVEHQAERLRFQWSKFRPDGYVERYSAQLSEATRGVLRSLYSMLLQPLEPLLTARKITVIPHSVLHGIPFHALHDGEQYALDRWEFAYAPSGAVWRACRLRREPDVDASLVFGISDPTIAHVRDEVAGLRKYLPEAQIFQDEEATLSAVPERGVYRYIHFATHAVFRQDNPLFSGLRLIDGWLMANDLYRRRLECRMATLSACRTGMGRVAPGDEVLGLARGFLHAGARAVMVSLWTAHDAATADLMQECYARLAAGEERAAALRAAQQAVREEYAHPYYWAAFALIGAR